MTDEQHRERVFAAYVQKLTAHLRDQPDGETASALAAAMMASAIAFDCQAIGAFRTSERLRDMADQIEDEALTVKGRKQ